ncbi:MAG: hypothetical protein CL933_01680 [Deltaproteobacteria bacterium]|nr:hypothetical protein [Deltaproteobacteria bacterium]
MDLMLEESIDAARRRGERILFEAIPEADEASRKRFPDVATEVTLNALVGLADGYSGEDLPRLIMRTPRRLGGTQVPGNRGLHDNPDTFYRLIPLDGQSHFVLVGVAPANPATIFELSALTAQWQTLANLTKTDLAIRPGSRFRILFRPAEAATDETRDEERCDHRVELTRDAEMLLVRETLADWKQERPSALTIENFVDRGGPRDVDDAPRIEAAAQRVEKWFKEAARLTLAPLAQVPNAFPKPVISGEHGKLVTMAYSIGHFWVRPGEALVLEIDPGEATYVGAPITNLWGTTNANLARGASLNTKQAALNADGSFTCVLSLEDPGVHNWLDPDGLERGFLFLRWAGLDPNRVPDRVPALETRLVPIGGLRAMLPAETRWVDAAERAQIQAERERDHALRFEEFLDE